jgi:DNA helicase-2/ATP-dependent DNA helicase PcrA
MSAAAKKFQPSPQQIAVFDFVEKGKGNAIVEAVAGAGKTTTIVEATKRMNGRVFLGAYNKKMGDELKERVRGMKDIYAATFHSFGFNALRFAFGKRFQLKVERNKVAAIIAVRAENDPDITPYATAIAKTVSMAKQRGFGPLVSVEDDNAWAEMCSKFDLDSDLPEECTTEQLVAYSKWALSQSNANLDVIDFDDMVYLPLQKNLRTLTHEWVLIDEAQDTNPTRRALARKMLTPSGRLIAVGDPMQAIFGFTGADNDSLDQIAAQFKAIRLPLTITYRCPKAVVRHAQTWVSHIQSGDSAPEGAVLNQSYDDMMSSAVAGDAILCRVNKPLVAACFAFIRAGKGAKIEGREVGDALVKLATKWRIKTIDVLRDRLDSYLSKQSAKFIAKKQEDKADRLTDQVETLFAIIDRAESQQMRTITELVTVIESLFADDVSSKGLIVLSSVHKSKGLEWNKVYLLGRESYMPSKFAKQDWQKDQERNLIYVAVTRAQSTLVEVPAPANGKKKEEAK